jgi:hypothetical protein
MSKRIRWVRAWGVVLLTVAVALGSRCAMAEIWTTTAALIGLGVAAVGLIAGRTWGSLLALAVGASFATAGALEMTNAPQLFFAIALAASLPCLLFARPMWRFDRAAALVLLAGSIALGSLGASGLRLAGDDVARALDRLESELDRSHRAGRCGQR